MIPKFTPDGLLPPGIHRAALDEFQARFVVFDRSDRRFRLYENMEKLIDECRRSGIVKRLIVAGSFVTSKPQPNDFDCIVVIDRSIIGAEIAPVDYNLVLRRMARRIYGGDVTPALEGSHALEKYLEFFQVTRDGARMGIVEIKL